MLKTLRVYNHFQQYYYCYYFLSIESPECPINSVFHC